MNHWQMIAVAYGLTFAALAVEVMLLFRRRRLAVEQARAWLDDEAHVAGPGALRDAVPAGAGGGAGAGARAGAGG
jgi:hypothetical protein